MLLQEAATLISMPESVEEEARSLDVRKWIFVALDKQHAQDYCGISSQHIAFLQHAMAQFNQDVPHISKPGCDRVGDHLHSRTFSANKSG